MELEDFAPSVVSRSDFVRFLGALVKDFQEHRDLWDNDNIESYFLAMHGFVRDMQGYYDNRGVDLDLTQPSWRVLADILLGARVYE